MTIMYDYNGQLDSSSKVIPAPSMDAYIDARHSHL